MNYFKTNLAFLIKQKNISTFDLSVETAIDLKKVQQFLAGKEPELEELIILSEFLNCSLDSFIKQDIIKKTSAINSFDFKMLVTDIDGVLTDAGMYYSESGDEMKKYNAKDGLAIKMLIEQDKKVGFISSGSNKNIINNRAKLFNIEHVYIGTWDKLSVLKEWCKELNISLKQVAYIGDDLNDLEIIKNVGLSACPNDSADEVKEISNIILSKNGGSGCLRELYDILKKNKKI